MDGRLIKEKVHSSAFIPLNRSALAMRVHSSISLLRRDLAMESDCMCNQH